MLAAIAPFAAAWSGGGGGAGGGSSVAATNAGRHAAAAAGSGRCPCPFFDMHRMTRAPSERLPTEKGKGEMVSDLEPQRSETFPSLLPPALSRCRSHFSSAAQPMESRKLN
ncbi:unnamed protein product [Phaeothamnion confervicola]